MARCIVFVVAIFPILLPNRMHASQDTIGVNGIASAGLGLTGNGIAIGQVEPGRPGRLAATRSSRAANWTAKPTRFWRPCWAASQGFLHPSPGSQQQRVRGTD
jgi:hypothetical protein